MTEASRTPLQQLNDYLFDQVDVVGQHAYVWKRGWVRKELVDV